MDPAPIPTVMVNEDRRIHSVHTCPIIDTYYLSPELSVTYVPVLRDVAGVKKVKGPPELKLVAVPKRGAALLMPYIPQSKNGQVYMQTPKGLCCCPTCLRLVINRCTSVSDWSAEICRVYELEGHITPARYQRTEQMFQSWDSAFPLPPAVASPDPCYQYPPMENI